MKYFYGEFDGEDFPTPESLFGFNQLMDFILQYGDQALKAMQQMMNDSESRPEASDLIEQMLRDGMLDKDGRGKLRLTPRLLSRLQHKALHEVFRNLRSGQREGHEKMTPGQGGERVEGTKPYEFGDPVSELDLHATLRNAMQRRSSERERASASSPASAGADEGQPAAGSVESRRIRFTERDLELHLHEGTTSCATVVLLDMSGSMMRYGRFLAAKKVALAMLALVRSRFQQDTLDFVGFYSGAQRVAEVALPLLMPKPVTVYDYSVRLRVKADELHKAPQHFTNLHMGLQMARRILRKRPAENKQIFVITDGQPTAHVEGDYVYLLYPPDERSLVATLKEAASCARDDIRLATFALIEDYWGMDWVSFVEQMTRLTKGVAFYTSSDQLASCIVESYLSGKKKKSYVR